MAPETMVAVVAQNTRLKTKVEAPVKLPSAGLAIKALKFANKSMFGRPTKPNKVSSPIIKVYPKRENTTVPIQKSMRFFIIMIPAFLHG